MKLQGVDDYEHNSSGFRAQRAQYPLIMEYLGFLKGPLKGIYKGFYKGIKD